MSKLSSYNLANLLASLSTQLANSNLVKELLHQGKFDAYSFFRLLDISNAHSLTGSELLNFCQANDISCTESELLLLTKWWDKDRDGVLSFSDFLYALTPFAYSVNKINANFTNLQPVTYSVKFSFIRVMLREIELLNELIVNTNSLCVSIDFSIQEAFNKITTGPFIRSYDLFMFITEQGVPVLMDDLSLLIEKFDTHKSCTLSYSDFSEILNLGIHQPRSMEITRTVQAKSIRSSLSSTVRQNFYNTLRVSSPKLANSSQGLKKTLTPSGSPKSIGTIWGFPQEFNPKSIISVLNYQISLDKKLECLQKDLYLMYDFTLIEAFKIFDKACNGYITTLELESTFNEYGIYPNKEQLFLLFRRYDKDCDGKLNFSEFRNLLETLEKNYHDLIGNREPQPFRSDTLELLTQVLKFHIKLETLSEAIRESFSSCNDTYFSFNALDVDQDGFISKIDLAPLFSRQDISFIMHRYCPSLQDLISFSEFSQELTPHSNFYKNL